MASQDRKDQSIFVGRKGRILQKGEIREEIDMLVNKASLQDVMGGDGEGECETGNWAWR